MDHRSAHPLLQAIDALQIPVPNLELGLAFYRDRLGHELVWRTATAAGLRMAASATEIVLQTERPELEANVLVNDADAAAMAMVAAGGSVLVPAFDIAIGRCVVVADPWGNRLVLLDMRRGPLVTDPHGYVRTQ